MDQLNYHHLHYFWAVAREGSIAAAAQTLHVGRPAISMQIKSLEASLGVRLFHRRGRGLELTDPGRVALEYAEEIFRTGRELVATLRDGPVGPAQRLRVGVADVMAKIVTFRLLDDALRDLPEVVIECREETPQTLFGELALHRLDLVLSDIPLTVGVDVRAYNHVLGESTVSLFAAPELADKLKQDFPRSLDGAPLLAPGRGAAVRSGLDAWLDSVGVAPRIVAECEDSALLKVFGAAGRGVFPSPTVIADEITRQYGVVVVRELPVRERFYAISTERRITHPVVKAIRDTAQAELFA